MGASLSGVKLMMPAAKFFLFQYIVQLDCTDDFQYLIFEKGGWCDIRPKRRYLRALSEEFIENSRINFSKGGKFGEIFRAGRREGLRFDNHA